jgi:hypothetical protein
MLDMRSATFVYRSISMFSVQRQARVVTLRPRARLGRGSVMAAYRSTWNTIAGVVAGIGLALALIAVPVGAIASLLIFGLLVGAAMTWAIPSDAAARPLRRVSWGGAVSGGAMVVVGGLSAAMGVIGLLVVLVMVITAPIFLAWLRRCLSRGEPAGSSPDEPVAKTLRPSLGTETTSVGDTATRALFAIEPTVLDDATLCAAWQISNVVLQQPYATDLNRLMEVRRQLLDELQRRHPTTFSSWLAAEPGATDDLTSYFTGHDNPPPTAGSTHSS